MSFFFLYEAQTLNILSIYFLSFSPGTVDLQVKILQPSSLLPDGGESRIGPQWITVRKQIRELKQPLAQD